jgi:hypothetical protein
MMLSADGARCARGRAVWGAPRLMGIVPIRRAPVRSCAADGAAIGDRRSLFRVSGGARWVSDGGESLSSPNDTRGGRSSRYCDVVAALPPLLTSRLST